MKKVKIIVGAILRGALLVAPGVAFGWWAWNKAMALIAILAAVGVETLFLFVFSFITGAVQARRNLRRKKAEEAEAEEGNDTAAQ